MLDQEHNGKQIKEILIERLVKEAIGGKYNFLREVLDRLEGRPAQKVELAQDQDIHIYYPRCLASSTTTSPSPRRLHGHRGRQPGEAVLASPDEQGQCRSEEPAKPKGKYDHLKPTQFKPGQSGNPGGRRKGESITATIRRLLAQEHNRRTVPEILAEKVIKEALSGKFNFAKELFDRVEGRPAQKIENAPQENLTIFVPPPRTFREGQPIPEGTRKVVRIDPDKL